MSVEVHEQMHRVLGQRQTSELLEIWQTNDQQKWSRQAIDVVREILQERQVALPAQNKAAEQAGQSPLDEGLEEVLGEAHLPTGEEAAAGILKDEPPAESFTWYRAWINACIHPSVRTFWEIAQDRKASLWRAYLWVAAASLAINSFKLLVHLNGLLTLISGGASGTAPKLTTSQFLLGMALYLLRAAFQNTLILAAFAGIAYLVARALRGKGSYVSLVYAFAAILAPLVLINGLLSVLPSDVIPTLSYVLRFALHGRLIELYCLSLFAMAIQAVHGFGLGKASLAVFFSIVLPFFAYLGIVLALP